MIGLVRLALRRPYTSAIAALLILLMGALSITRMIVDIFPVIDIPVVLVVWNYNGLTTEDMERRVVFISERAYSTTVNGISRIESQSIPSIGILKVYFQPGTDIGSSIAQITSVNNSILRGAPPGMQPPGVIQFNASNVPVVQMTLSSKTLTEQQIYDYSLNFIRVRLFTIPGLSTPGPFGGKSRQIMVDLDQSRLEAKGFAPVDVVNALQASNVIVPAGTARLGDREYNVQLNSSPTAVDRFNALPIGVFNGAPVTIGDVGKVSDSYATQGNVVHVNGKRAVYLAILKHADASTLAVVDAAREALPEIQAAAPAGLELKLDFDQSVFVRAAVQNVIREAIISSILVSALILVFLGSWRNTVIVSTSIPLSIFAGIMGLFLTGNTHQPDDAGRARAGDRPAGGQCHGDDREHPPQPVAGQTADGGDHRRQQRGDPAADRRHAGDLHRVLPGRAAVRRGALPVHPARRHRRVLHAGVLRAVVHRGAGVRALPAGIRGAASRPAARLLRPVRPRLQPLPRRLRPDAGRRAAPPRVRAGLRRRHCWWYPADWPP